MRNLKQIFKNHFSPALVISSIALFVALSGASYAAFLAPNSVGTKQLKNNAVSTKKIKKNAVTSSKIKSGSVSSAKIKNGSVTSNKIAPGVLTTGPAGPTGPTGYNGTNGSDGVAKVHNFSYTPSYPINASGGTILLNQDLPLSGEGYVLNGFIEVFAPSGAPMTISCEVNKDFVDASNVQVGDQQLVSSPQTTIVNSGERTTIPITGVPSTRFGPNEADHIRIIVFCESTSSGAEASEIQMSAILANQVD